MNSGYVLFCGKTAFAQCLSRKLFTCAGEAAEDIKPIRKGSVLFIYNTDTKNLVGPFTAASEGAQRIETGAWTSKIDDSSVTGSIRLEWEDLHVIENAAERFPFLGDSRECGLSPLKTQNLLDALKEAPTFKGQ
jgi:hypothetical protein